MTRTIAVVAMLIATAQSVGCSATAPATSTRPYCAASALRLTVGPRISEKMEQETFVLEFRNISAAACEVRGYPDVALADGRGARLPFSYLRRGDQMITGLPPVLVRLPPGSVAYSAINKNSCVEFARATATRVEVAPPAGGEPVVLGLPRYPVLGYCGAGDPGHTVDISPVEPAFADIYASN